MQTVTSLEFCASICYFCRKYIMFESKKCRGFTYHNTEIWCKNWGRTDLCLEKWDEEFGVFPEAVENFKISTLRNIFVQGI